MGHILRSIERISSVKLSHNVPCIPVLSVKSLAAMETVLVLGRGDVGRQ